MGNTSAEILKQLKKHGWTLLRNGSKHDVYAKGDQKILIPRGGKMYSRNYKQIVWKIQGKTIKSKPLTVNPRTSDESHSIQDQQDA